MPSDMRDLYDLTIGEAVALVGKREISSRELTQAHLARIEAVDEKVRAFLTVTSEPALAQADAADKRIASGEQGPLLGVPVALKDVLCTKGVATTCSIEDARELRPAVRRHVVERLRAAGAVMVGKTNMDEFAMGSSTENSAFFPTRNPWDLDRVPGGSSGGSAAAVGGGRGACSRSAPTPAGRSASRRRSAASSA